MAARREARGFGVDEAGMAYHCRCEGRAWLPRADGVQCDTCGRHATSRMAAAELGEPALRRVSGAVDSASGYGPWCNDSGNQQSLDLAATRGGFPSPRVFVGGTRSQISARSSTPNVQAEILRAPSAARPATRRDVTGSSASHGPTRRPRPNPQLPYGWDYSGFNGEGLGIKQVPSHVDALAARGETGWDWWSVVPGAATVEMTQTGRFVDPTTLAVTTIQDAFAGWTYWSMPEELAFAYGDEVGLSPIAEETVGRAPNCYYPKVPGFQNCLISQPEVEFYVRPAHMQWIWIAASIPSSQRLCPPADGPSIPEYGTLAGQGHVTIDYGNSQFFEYKLSPNAFAIPNEFLGGYDIRHFRSINTPFGPVREYANASAVTVRFRQGYPKRGVTIRVRFDPGEPDYTPLLVRVMGRVADVRLPSDTWAPGY